LRYNYSIFILLLFGISIHLNAQTAIVKGIVKNNLGNPINGVAITFGNKGTVTNKQGSYKINIPIKKYVQLTFTHISYKTIKKTIKVNSNKTINFSPVLNYKTETINEIKLKDNAKKVNGLLKIKESDVKNLPGVNQGVENLLKTLPGVNSNNELSTQYNVRGGNYDENLVYINGIEIYRPFLVRSGKQEGLSIINPNLIKNIYFSAGGFTAKYGDKLSSVLDITYKKPKTFGLSASGSFLGGSITYENLTMHKKLSSIVGVRYRNNNLFFNSSNLNSNFKPSYTDAQSYFSYRISKKFNLDFLGNLSINNYLDEPISRITNFGTLDNLKALVVNYKGREKDKFYTILGALKATYKVKDNLIINFISSIYNTQEEEHFDINAFYNIGDVNTDFGGSNFGEVQFTQAIGSQLNHARNDLDALISNFQIKGKYILPTSLIEFGAKYQTENFKDRIIEWEMIDSAGFSLRPPNFTIQNNQPYTPFSGPLVAYQNTHAKNNITINRISGFAQLRKKLDLNRGKLWVNVGLRAQNWKVLGKKITTSSQTIISPRIQLLFKPKSNKNMLFKIASGVYDQPPFYKELRDSLGIVHPNIKAQKSIHLVLGNEYTFQLWDRSFKLSTETYYKKLTDVNPFTVENVRIRYDAKNNARAYAYGFEMRLNGEFVPNTQSWFSFGYLNTKENVDNKGFIPRPTDQRLKFAVLFQDYVPKYPNLKMYMNMVYNTGVPGGSPLYADRYQFKNRLPAYKRADIGISYVFVDEQNSTTINWLNSFKEFSIGIEIFNLFDVQNTITNTWVKDVSSKMSFAVPNFLTGRVFNINLHFKI